MRLTAKFLAIIGFVGVVPLAVAAFTTVTLHRKLYAASVIDLQRKAAQTGTLLTERWLTDAQRTLARSVNSIDWAALDSRERQGAVWLIYRQLDDVAVASLLDDRGQGLTASAYVAPDGPVPELDGHPNVMPAALEAFASRIPFAAAMRDRAGTGELFLADGMEHPLLPVAVASAAPDAPRFVVALALSLRGLCRDLARLERDGTSAYAVAPSGERVCGAMASPLSAQMRALLDQQASGGQVAGEGEQAMLSAWSRDPAGWTVVVETPARSAFAASARIQQQLAFWILTGLCIALVVGVYLARSITLRIRQLGQGAEELARGNLTHRLEVDGADELSELSVAFNRMGSEISQRDAEIRAWNEELQTRVADRTEKLREAQQQLVRTEKIAAVATLGAGFAHEINNPLTTVLGLSQVLKTQLGRGLPAQEAVRLIGMIETDAGRIRDVVKLLLAASENYTTDGYRVLLVHAVLDECLTGVEARAGGEKIDVVKSYSSDLPPVVGNPVQLQQVVQHLLSNARTAMKEKGGQLRVSARAPDSGSVEIAITDTGKGILPEHLSKIFNPFFTTKDDWKGEGMGLTIAHRIVEEHRGRIEVQSAPGQGTTMTIVLPAAERGVHLV